MPIRSYVRREGRITKAQTRALAELWPVYGVEPPPGPLEPRQVFGREGPLVMEVGFGDGETLAAMAAEDPQSNFLGVEVFRPGVGRLLLRLEQLGLTNVRVAMHDADEVLRDWIPERSLSQLLIFFPDPWPKKRHHKRRLITTQFVAVAAGRLAPGGYIHVATDWEDYAMQILELLEREARLRNAGGDRAFVPGRRLQTKYESRGKSRGHRVWDMVFERVA